MSKNVLIIGNGGREHALVWKLAQSPRIGNLYVAPGNGGTRQIAENVPINAIDIDELVQFAEKHAIDLTVVGPEDALARGIVDAFYMRGLPIFGPTREATKIESSKAFAKQLMEDVKIPTASFRVFQGYPEALAHIRKHDMPIVIKADGLALGKGVYVCETFAQAQAALTRIMLDRIHQDAGDTVIVEEFLGDRDDGKEISLHAFCDGKSFALSPPAQDHKPVGDGDRGKNTGGMGVIAPVPWVNADLMEQADWIVSSTLAELDERGRAFSGCLYPGLKMTATGLNVLEFNARFGDPEAQVYLRLLKTDLLDVLEACVDGTLADLTIEWHSGFAACVVLASGGYPDQYKKNVPIYGIREAERVSGVLVFHAGTRCTDQLRTSGGRVLGVSAIGNTLREALDRAYQAAPLITFEDVQYRRDIGAKALATNP